MKLRNLRRTTPCFVPGLACLHTPGVPPPSNLIPPLTFSHLFADSISRSLRTPSFKRSFPAGHFFPPPTCHCENASAFHGPSSLIHSVFDPPSCRGDMGDRRRSAPSFSICCRPPQISHPPQGESRIWLHVVWVPGPVFFPHLKDNPATLLGRMKTLRPSRFDGPPLLAKVLPTLKSCPVSGRVFRSSPRNQPDRHGPLLFPSR